MCSPNILLLVLLFAFQVFFHCSQEPFMALAAAHFHLAGS